MLDVFTMDSSSLPEGTRVVGFRGTEGISRLYAFEIHVTLDAAHSDDFELSDPMGAEATLVLDRQDGRPPFLFHGIFSEAALVHHEPDGRALLRTVLVPHLWRLTQTFHSRIFTGQSIPDVLEAILKDNGLSTEDYELRLSQQYEPEEHVCQYDESDFDFMSRWMEREGLYYFFEQRDEREKLVITDNAAAHVDLAPAPVRFFALAGADTSAKECLQSFVCRQRTLPASVRFKDYDYTNPTLEVCGTAPVSRSGLGEISVHGARFFTPDAGKRLAKLRAEEIQSREVVYTGSGTSFYLRAGYTFTLEDHPRASFDAPYLVTEVEHYGNQGASTAELRRLTRLDLDEVYRADVTAIPKATQYRAELRTAWPRIYGTEHGVVDGEAFTDYAQLDEHGRYAVRFAFDESCLEDGKASTRVRMMQPHGGSPEGWHFPLRKGTEVLFTFLGGDPDRPVIAGVVPNATTPSPVTQGNQTTNVIQTGGKNRFELEDEAGQEQITLSTPYASTRISMGAPDAGHELDLTTDANVRLNAGGKWDVTIGKTLNEVVSGNVDEAYLGNKTELVPHGQVTEEYQAQETTVKTQHTDISATRNTLVEGLFGAQYGTHVVKVDGNRNENIGGNVTVEIGGNRNEKVGGNVAVVIDGTFKQTVNGPVDLVKTAAYTSITLGATSDTFIGVKHSAFVGGQVSLTVGASASSKLSADFSLSVGAAVAIKLAAELSVTDGIRLGLTGGVALSVNMALALSITPLKIQQANAHLKSIAGASLKAAPFEVANLGAFVVS